MATKEDILEQIVEEYLVHKGYFVQHNIKFLPRKDHPDFILNQDSNHSDIDVIGYHPLIEGDKVRRGRKAWQAFRELTAPKWSEGFVGAVRDATVPNASRISLLSPSSWGAGRFGKTTNRFVQPFAATRRRSSPSAYDHPCLHRSRQNAADVSSGGHEGKAQLTRWP